MTRAQARRALIDAVQIVDANRDAQTWAEQWERMGKVQREYSGPLSLEPLLMLKPPPPENDT